MLLVTSKPNVLRDVRPQEDPTHDLLYTEAEEETDQVFPQVPREEELVHRPRGRGVQVAVEGVTSTTGLGSPRSPRSRKTKTQKRSKLPKDPEQDF